MESQVKFKTKTKVALMIYGLFIGTIASSQTIAGARLEHKLDPVVQLVIRYAEIARPFVIMYKILFYFALFILIMYALDILLGIGTFEIVIQSFKDSPAYN